MGRWSRCCLTDWCPSWLILSPYSPSKEWIQKLMECESSAPRCSGGREGGGKGGREREREMNAMTMEARRIDQPTSRRTFYRLLKEANTSVNHLPAWTGDACSKCRNQDDGGEEAQAGADLRHASGVRGREAGNTTVLVVRGCFAAWLQTRHGHAREPVGESNATKGPCSMWRSGGTCKALRGKGMRSADERDKQPHPPKGADYPLPFPSIYLASHMPPHRISPPSISLARVSSSPPHTQDLPPCPYPSLLPTKHSAP